MNKSPAKARALENKKCDPDDLVGHRSNIQQEGLDGITITIIAHPAFDPNSTNKYKIRVKELKGDDAWIWLEKARLVKWNERKKNYVQTPTYRKWRNHREKNELYWQHCPDLIKYNDGICGKPITDKERIDLKEEIKKYYDRWVKEPNCDKYFLGPVGVSGTLDRHLDAAKWTEDKAIFKAILDCSDKCVMMDPSFDRGKCVQDCIKDNPYCIP